MPFCCWREPCSDAAHAALEYIFNTREGRHCPRYFSLHAALPNLLQCSSQSDRICAFMAADQLILYISAGSFGHAMVMTPALL
jgi:hypothetical protein